MKISSTMTADHLANARWRQSANTSHSTRRTLPKIATWYFHHFHHYHHHRPHHRHHGTLSCLSFIKNHLHWITLFYLCHCWSFRIFYVHRSLVGSVLHITLTKFLKGDFRPSMAFSASWLAFATSIFTWKGTKCDHISFDKPLFYPLRPHTAVQHVSLQPALIGCLRNLWYGSRQGDIQNWKNFVGGNFLAQVMMMMMMMSSSRYFTSIPLSINVIVKLVNSWNTPNPIQTRSLLS